MKKAHIMRGMDVIGLVLFAVVFLTVLVSSVQRNAHILWILPVLFVLCFLLFRSKNLKTAFCCCFCVMCVVQLFLGYLLMVEYSTWDVYAVTKNAAALVNGEYVNRGYFAQYPNNTAIMLLFALVFKITKVLFGSTSVWVLVILNIAAIDAAIIFSMKIIKLLVHEQAAFRMGILAACFAPYYLYVPICYTDTFSMPWIAASLYYLLRIVYKGEDSKKNYLKLALVGVVIALGSQLKGSVIIILIAALLCLFFRFPIKRFLPHAASLVAGVLVLSVVFNFALDQSGLIEDELYEAKQMPPTHWIMMGLTGRGNYNGDDVAFTSSFETYSEKQEATMEQIKVRLQEMGVGGFLSHVHKKATQYTWNFGTCYAARYLGEIGDAPILRNILHEFVLSKGKYSSEFYAMTQGIYLLIFGFAVAAYLRGILHPDESSFLLRVSLLGCLLFFMLWETHPRYILNYTLVMIMLASQQLEFVNEKIGRLVCLRRGDKG